MSKISGRFTSLLSLMIFLSLFSCGNGLDLGDFDKEKWIADLNGCSGDRSETEMISALNELKPKLLGLYQKRILKILGQPESEELYKRSQVYYFYAIDPSEKCDSKTKNPRKLEIRFTALGIANEVNIR